MKNEIDYDISSFYSVQYLKERASSIGSIGTLPNSGYQLASNQNTGQRSLRSHQETSFPYETSSHIQGIMKSSKNFASNGALASTHYSSYSSLNHGGVLDPPLSSLDGNTTNSYAIRNRQLQLHNKLSNSQHQQQSLTIGMSSRMPCNSNGCLDPGSVIDQSVHRVQEIDASPSNQNFSNKLLITTSCSSQNGNPNINCVAQTIPLSHLQRQNHAMLKQNAFSEGHLTNQEMDRLQQALTIPPYPDFPDHFSPHSDFKNHVRVPYHFDGDFLPHEFFNQSTLPNNVANPGMRYQPQTHFTHQVQPSPPLPSDIAYDFYSLDPYLHGRGTPNLFGPADAFYDLAPPPFYGMPPPFLGPRPYRYIFESMKLKFRVI